jgi:RNA polymerase sigma factor (sigma-70 family)
MENDATQQLIGCAFKLYSSDLYHYIVCRIHNEEDAKDIVQDTFMRLLDNTMLLRMDTMKSYLYTIAHNIIIDYTRKKTTQQKWTSDSVYGEEQVCHPEHDYAANELLQLEQERAMRLPERRQQVYCLSRYEGLTCKEIATRLDMNPRTVEKHLLLGRQDVRGYLKAINW